VSAVLANSAIRNNDKVGVILFSDKIEKFIPPKKGNSHILRIIRELVDLIPASKGTNLTVALNYLNNVIRKRSVVFLLSDFMTDNYEPMLHIAARKHDIIGIHVFDHGETVLPEMGLLQVQDAETGKIKCIDTSGSAIKKQYAKKYADHLQAVTSTFQRSGIDYVSINTHDNYIRALMMLFERRTKRI
ncbi:MAG: VWA domain-containing protein, partial [Chitinophagales bacterium]